MAAGIQFYKNKKYDLFKESDETINFTKLMNDMFDALNRRHPFAGIGTNSHDLEVFFKCFVCVCVFICLY